MLLDKGPYIARLCNAVSRFQVVKEAISSCTCDKHVDVSWFTKVDFYSFDYQKNFQRIGPCRKTMSRLGDLARSHLFPWYSKARTWPKIKLNVVYSTVCNKLWTTINMYFVVWTVLTFCFVCDEADYIPSITWNLTPFIVKIRTQLYSIRKYLEVLASHSVTTLQKVSLITIVVKILNTKMRKSTK